MPDLTPAELIRALDQVNDSERIIRLIPKPSDGMIYPDQECMGKSAEQLIAELLPESDND